MNSAPNPRLYEFFYPETDTLVQVESCPDEITIRTTRNSFNDVRKQAFLRELAAEGFIPDECRWSSPLVARVRWLVDYGWLIPSRETQSKTRRLVLLTVAVSGLLWIAMLTTLFLYSAR